MKIVSVGRNFGVKSKTRIQKMRQLRGRAKLLAGVALFVFLFYVLFC